MVSEKVKVKDKHRRAKKLSIKLLILLGIIIILAGAYFLGFFHSKPPQITLEHPMKEIIFANTNEAGQVNKQAVIQQGISEFNEQYIIYLLVSLGVNNIHKSYVGYGNAEIDLIIDQETWSAIVSNGLSVSKQPSPDPDLKIRMSKQEAVKALLSSNIQEYLKDSVNNGNTQLEQVSNKIELASKGYLKMYTTLTEEVIDIE
tara:strand:- start:37 stop:642 length:606 start_codon:yes stop_codon:yes gene_type:complete